MCRRKNTVFLTCINKKNLSLRQIRKREEGKNPLVIDSKAPNIPVREYAYNETRFKMLTKSKPEDAKKLITLLQEDVNEKWHMYENMAKIEFAG